MGGQTFVQPHKPLPFVLAESKAKSKSICVVLMFPPDVSKRMSAIKVIFPDISNLLFDIFTP